MVISATYDPADDKIRISASQRLDAETYARVKSAGYGWAPKQGVFYAVWTPEREDVALDLAGEIGDEDTTLVERAEQRAERFEGYHENRTEDAERAHKAVSAIADGIPFGQPILVGHHSERHARRDAEKIENGMRRAVKMWETAQYWQSRAAGALAHAKYKELPAVRERRIKGLESDLRKQDKYIQESEMWLKLWRACGEEQDKEKKASVALKIAGMCHLTLARKEGDKEGFDQRPSAYNALRGDYPNLYAPRTLEEVLAAAERAYPRSIAHHTRWADHLRNRLAYEIELLGTRAADKWPVQVGGRVLRGGEWLVVLRVNKSGGSICSVTTNARYVSVVGIEDIQDYREPEGGEAETVKAAVKGAPLCNFKSEGCIEMTAAEWKAKSGWGDAWAVRKFDVNGGFIWRGETAYRQRSRYNLGSMSNESKVIPVFITDAKVVEPPKVKPEPVALPERIIEPATVAAPRFRMVNGLDDLTPEMFQRRDGTFHAGVEYEYAGEGESACYQFSDLRELVEYARGAETQPHMRKYRLVTFEPGYQKKQTRYKWDALGEAIDGLKDSLKTGVKVVSAPQLFPTPAALAKRMVELAGVAAGDRVLEPSAGTGVILHAMPEGVERIAVEINHNLAAALRRRFDGLQVTEGDFLEQNGNLGKFDAVVMNPPFVNADDIKHILHARRFLNAGGSVVAICANGPRQREALMDLAEHWEDLPAGTFAESGTQVNTALVVMRGCE